MFWLIRLVWFWRLWFVSLCCTSCSVVLSGGFDVAHVFVYFCVCIVCICLVLLFGFFTMTFCLLFLGRFGLLVFLCSGLGGVHIWVLCVFVLCFV